MLAPRTPTLSLTVAGEVDLTTLAEMVARLEALLTALAEEIAPGTPVRWRVVAPTDTAPVSPAGPSPS